jgi:hypothetical protein
MVPAASNAARPAAVRGIHPGVNGNGSPGRPLGPCTPVDGGAAACASRFFIARTCAAFLCRDFRCRFKWCPYTNMVAKSAMVRGGVLVVSTVTASHSHNGAVSDASVCVCRSCCSALRTSATVMPATADVALGSMEYPLHTLGMDFDGLVAAARAWVRRASTPEQDAALRAFIVPYHNHDVGVASDDAVQDADDLSLLVREVADGRIIVLGLKRSRGDDAVTSQTNIAVNSRTVW